MRAKDKTADEPDMIAQQIYAKVMENISDYIAGADIPADEQYSTFRYISSEVSSFLMGNAVSPLSPGNQGEVIATLGKKHKENRRKHIRRRTSEPSSSFSLSLQFHEYLLFANTSSALSFVLACQKRVCYHSVIYHQESKLP